jgi:hypothetical protein
VLLHPKRPSHILHQFRHSGLGQSILLAHARTRAHSHFPQPLLVRKPLSCLSLSLLRVEAAAAAAAAADYQCYQ